MFFNVDNLLIFCYIPAMVGIEALVYFADIHSELDARFSMRNGELLDIMIDLPVFKDGKIYETMESRLIRYIPDATARGIGLVEWPDDWWDRVEHGKRHMRDDFGPGIVMSTDVASYYKPLNGEYILRYICIEWPGYPKMIDLRNVNSAMLEEKYASVRRKIERWKQIITDSQKMSA